jgi:CPA1 family monovalent cation:H+ antiporter
MLMTIAIVFGLTALCSVVNERWLGLQQTIGLMLMALVGSLVLALLSSAGLTSYFIQEKTFVEGLALDQTLLNGVLCFMLFAGSINVKSGTLDQEKWVIIALAIGATLIAATLIGVSMWGALGLLGISVGFIYAFIFGALISPTDPIAALAILGKVGLPPRLEAIINGESLFNDGVGVVIFTIGLTIASGASQPTAGDAVVMFLREVLGGIALGLSASFIMHRLFLRTKDYGTQVLLSVSIVALAYSISESIEVSGPIAMVVTGLVIGNYTMPRIIEAEREQFKTFWQAVDEGLNSSLFVLMGLHVALVPMLDTWVPTAVCAIVVCLAVRWVSVYLPLSALVAGGVMKADKIGLSNLLTWGGLRGGLALAMALSLPSGPEKDLILHMTYGVVAFSIIVQGLSISRIFKADALKRLLPDDQGT